MDLSAFASLKTVYSINSSKFDILTADGTETVALDEAVKDAKPNVEAIQNFARANVPYGYISSYRYAQFGQFTRSRLIPRETIPRKISGIYELFIIFSTTSGSTGKPKILEFENKWMGEFPVYEKDVQGPGDIFKLCGKFGCSRTMKIAKGKNNLGMLFFDLIDFKNYADSTAQPLVPFFPTNPVLNSF